MEVVELTESKCDEAEEDHPRLPAVELILPIHYCANKQLDCRFRHEEGMGGQDTADAAI